MKYTNVETFNPDVHSSTFISVPFSKEDESAKNGTNFKLDFSIDEADKLERNNNAPPMQVVFTMRWIYVGGLEKNTTAEQIREHLIDIWPGKTFYVYNMRHRGNYSIFKVGSKELCYDELLCKSNWPKEATVEIFRSPKKSRFRTGCST